MFIFYCLILLLLFLISPFTFGGFIFDPTECNEENQYISRGRFQMTCLKTESELVNILFLSKRCHCNRGFYRLGNQCVDTFNCMLACREAQPRYGNNVDCFCDTATGTMYNHISCAWNAKPPIGKYVKWNSRDLYSDKEPQSK